MSIDVDAEHIVVKSDDFNDEGIYEVIVTASTPADYTYTALSATTTLSV